MRGSWICVDAGLVLRLALDPNDAVALPLFQRWQREGRSLAAPTLLPYEVTQALHRYEQRGVISPAARRLALQAALALPIRLHDDMSLHNDALNLVEQFALPSLYAAYYLALAVRLEATLWSADRRLVEAVREAFPWAHLAGE